MPPATTMKLLPDGSPQPPPGLMEPPKGKPMSPRTPQSGKLRATFRKGTSFGTFMDLPKDLQPPDPNANFVENRYDVRAIQGERRRLGLEVKELKQSVRTRDERLRYAANLSMAQEQLCVDELRLADAERESLEEAQAHAAVVADAAIHSAYERLSISDSAADLLSSANHARFDAVRELHEERLHRREDAGRMHGELTRLRNHLDREMRAGLELFREQYQAAAYEQAGPPRLTPCARLLCHAPVATRSCGDTRRGDTWLWLHTAAATTAAWWPDFTRPKPHVATPVTMHLPSRLPEYDRACLTTIAPA